MESRKSKYTWMLVLMISSELLLTVFISTWLVNRFRQERTQLFTECNREFMTAYDRQVDSLLMKHLINPALKDSMMLRVDLSGVHAVEWESDSNLTSVLVPHHESDTSVASGIFAFRMKDSVNLEEERLVRSVKLFITETDEALRSNSEAHAFVLQVDTAALRSMLHEQFLARDWEFTLNWYADSVQLAHNHKIRGLLLNSPDHHELPALYIQHMGSYMLGQIFPEGILALILIGLSASALIIAYRSLRKQLALNELRDDFIANISHELKTPVSTVKVALEALQKFDLKSDPKVTADYLEMASREAVRLEGLIEKVLRHRLLDDPGRMFQNESCDLRLILSSSIRSMEIPIRERGAVLNVREPESPCMVMADPVYLEGVIMNLIDNSLKYAGPRPEIQIIIESDGNVKKLKIRDNGPGIPEEYKKQVFDKFFRIPEGDRHNVKGYGLGLNFASQVMSRLGGGISFRNLNGKGCEFVLVFPEH